MANELTPEREKEIRAASEYGYPFDDGSQGQAGADVKVLLVEIDRLRCGNAAWVNLNGAWLDVKALVAELDRVRRENVTLRQELYNAVRESVEVSSRRG